MPTTERYVLNELQQATLDVMAANVMPGDDEDLTRAAMTREDIIAGVQAVPGQDEVNGNHMGPTLHCLKRRGLVAEASWPAKGQFHITPAGITYVDLDGEPEPEVPRGEFAMEEVDKAVEEIEAEQQAPEAPGVTHIDPTTRRVVLPQDEWLLEQAAIRAGASTTACDDQHRPEPAEPDAELEAAILANRDAVIAREQALEEMDAARPRELNPITSSLTNHQAEERALEEGTCLDGRPCGTPPSPGDDAYCLGCPNYAEDSDHAADPARPAPEVTILSVAVHPPGTAWLDNDATVLIKLMDEGSGPYLDISSWDGPAAIESLEMLEAVTNTARNLLREAEAREVAQ